MTETWETQRRVDTLAAVAPDVGGEVIGVGVCVDAAGVPIWAEIPEDGDCPNQCGGWLTVLGPPNSVTNVTPVRCDLCGFRDY